MILQQPEIPVPLLAAVPVPGLGHARQRGRGDRASTADDPFAGVLTREFLHTGDWHVGKTLQGRSRQDEHEAVLAEILGIARRERGRRGARRRRHCSTAAPSPEAERLVY